MGEGKDHDIYKAQDSTTDWHPPKKTKNSSEAVIRIYVHDGSKFFFLQKAK